MVDCTWDESPLPTESSMPTRAVCHPYWHEGGRFLKLISGDYQMSNHTPSKGTYLLPADREKVANRALSTLQTLRIALASPDMELCVDYSAFLLEQTCEDIESLCMTLSTIQDNLEASHD